MNPLFSSGNRRALSAARKRTHALAAIGLGGAAAVCILSVPSGARAQTGAVPRNASVSPRAPYLPADAPAQLVEQDYQLRLMRAQALARQRASQQSWADQIKEAKRLGVPVAGSRDEAMRQALVAYRNQLASGVNGPNVGTVSAYLNALAHRDAMPALETKEITGPIGRAPNRGGSRLPNRPVNGRPINGGSGGSGGSGGGPGLAVANATRVNIGSTRGPWEFVGPQQLVPQLDSNGNLLNPLIGNQEVAGRVNAVTFDPASSRLDGAGNPSAEVFYIATSNSGVWRYTQNSNHPVPPTPSNATPVLTYGQWEPLSDFSFPVLETSAIAVNPANNKIIYAGTGDYPGRQGLGYGYGIMRSTDAGKTWLNVGNGNPGVTVGTVPPLSPTTPTNAPIMEGTSVSSITIDPVNPSLIMASTGRGVRAGALWRSTDGGNTWTNVTPQGVNGNWSQIDYSASPTINANGLRTYYASCEGVGAFISVDQGLTWTNLSNGTSPNGKPYSLPLIYTNSILISASKLPRQAVRPTDAQGSDIIYVLQASQNVNDSRQYKSLDKGETWIEITGLPTAVGFDNNFSSADYTLALLTATVPVTNYLTTPDQNGIYPTVLEEALYGSGRTLAGGRGGVFFTNTAFPQGDFLYSFNPTTQSASPTYFDLGVQPPFVDITESLGPDRLAHVNQHGTAVSPNDNRRILTVNDGGVNRFIYTPGYAADAVPHPYLYLDNSDTNTTWTQDGEQINDLLGIAPFEQADFVAQDNSATNFFVVGGLYQNQTVRGALTFAGVSPTAPTLASATWNLTPQVPVGNNRGIIVNGVQITDVPTQPNTNGVPTGTLPGVTFVHTNSALYFNSLTTLGRAGLEQFGSTGYTGATNGNDNWPNARLYWTNDNWTNGLDITPDRFFRNAQGVTLFNTAGAIVNVYNSNDPNDTTTQSNWRGEPKPPITKWAFGTSHRLNTRGPVQSPVIYRPVIPVNAQNPTALPVVYIGTNRVWRFDPPGQATAPLQPGTTAPATPPNQDRGIWRRVGTQQLASGTGTISAITIVQSSASREGDVAYVGTTNGELWVSSNFTDENGATLPLPPLTATWTQIGGPGSGNATLPSSPTNPITSISLNSAAATATFGDILVGLGGNPTVGGPARVYRASNTLGVPTGVRPVFTSQQGQGFASLPDVPVNDIARDPDDPTNTIFVATDVGVFASTNGGGTWANATAPLGLPNVRCTSLKVVTGTTAAGTANRFLMVSTYGRGVFRFDLANLALPTTGPKLTFTQTFSRSGSLLVVNLTILNSGSTAQNVNLTGATLDANGVTTDAINPANGLVVSPTNPLVIGAVGSGQSTTVALRYPASVGRAGTAVVFKVKGTYTLPPFPPGTPATFNNDPGVRTRLP